MKTILIIEDNEDIRENMAEIVLLSGFAVFTAENGKEGIILATNNHPDIILCDVFMPQVSGYDVLKELKNNPATSLIPFIYVTAGGEKSEVKLAMDLGAVGFIRKPFEGQELLNEIKKYLPK
ncbi:N/A [soil metagenome]